MHRRLQYRRGIPPAVVVAAAGGALVEALSSMTTSSVCCPPKSTCIALMLSVCARVQGSSCGMSICEADGACSGHGMLQ